MNKVGWIIFSVAVIALLGGLVIWTRVSNPPIELGNIQNAEIVAASTQNGDIADHTKGSGDNKVILIEYGDYQCPSCAGAHPNVNELMEEYNEDVTFVFRNFPLTAIHPNTRAASAVAEAAGLQGKYWEMHDVLYERQNDWSTLDASQRTTVFNGYAQELELDVEKFNSDIAGENVGKKINFDLALGKKATVSATPTFFLNGEKLDDAASTAIVQGNLDAIKQQLDDLIAETN